MAHLVESMAFRNATPWHGLGNRLTENQPLEVWLKEAGMEWHILNAPVQCRAGVELQDFADQQVLYRSDTLRPLSVVSKRYQVVQPREVLEFYRDLVEVGGFSLETSGKLAPRGAREVPNRRGNALHVRSSRRSLRHTASRKDIIRAGTLVT
jgi:phage/plasmid-like protein (TIGR03299 family)